MEVFFSNKDSLGNWELTSNKISELGLNTLGEYKCDGEDIEFPVFYSNGENFIESFELKEDHCFAIFPDEKTILEEHKIFYYNKLVHFFNNSKFVIAVYLHRYCNRNALAKTTNFRITYCQRENILHESSIGSPYNALFRFILRKSEYESIYSTEIIKGINSILQKNEYLNMPQCYKRVFEQDTFIELDNILKQNISKDLKNDLIHDLLKSY